MYEKKCLMELKVNFYLFENLKHRLKFITNKQGFNDFDDIHVKIGLTIILWLKSCYTFAKGFGGPRLKFCRKTRENV